MAHRVVSMRQAIVDTFTNNLSEVVADCCRNIFANHIATERQWQTGVSLPPFSKIDNPLKAGVRISELSFVNEQTGVSTPFLYRLENSVEWNNDEIEFPQKKLQCQKGTGHLTWHSDNTLTQQLASAVVSH